jgi:hypothetical protein
MTFKTESSYMACGDWVVVKCNGDYHIHYLNGQLQGRTSCECGLYR